MGNTFFSDKIIATLVIGFVVVIGFICYAAYKCYKKKPKSGDNEKVFDPLILVQTNNLDTINPSLNES